MTTINNLKDWTLSILAIIVMLGFFGIVYLVIMGKMVNTDPNLLVMIGGVIGYASAKADQVTSFYFGSSKGSEEKNATITDALSKMPAASTTTTTGPTPTQDKPHA